MLNLLIRISIITPITLMLMINSSFASTRSLTFDIGDIQPRGRIKVNMNPKHWPGFLNIKCEIIDEYNANNQVVIRVTNEKNPDGSQVNNDSFDLNSATHNFYDDPQVTLSNQKNILAINNMYNAMHFENEGADNYLTIENLDDDDTISIKSCFITPSKSSKNEHDHSVIFYCPEKIECSQAGTASSCKPVGENSEIWSNMSINGVNEKGSYPFFSAVSNPNNNGTPYSMCEYMTSNAFIYFNNSNIHFLQEGATKCTVSGGTAQCQGNTKECPFAT